MLTAAVILVTYERPALVERCLTHLELQTTRPDEVIVVDSSHNTSTAEIVRRRPHVSYLRNDAGYGDMIGSRRIGWQASHSEIIAFIDDDAFAEPEWLQTLLDAYTESEIGAVGGRALNGQPNEDNEGADQIGRLLPDGRLTGYFAADPGHVIDVDHLIGCNMSFRQTTLASIGGPRSGYTGTEVREETDICFRVRSHGQRILFAPGAVVHHLGAAQAHGKRFDHRYDYFSARNHVVLLSRNPQTDGMLARFIVGEMHRVSVGAFRSIVGQFGRVLFTGIGLFTGFCAGRRLRKTDAHPMRKLSGESADRPCT